MTTYRELLDEEIKVTVVASKGVPDDTYYRGRLGALLWVQDRLLSDSSREGELVAALEMITVPVAKPWWELPPGSMALRLQTVDSIARAALAQGKRE